MSVSSKRSNTRSIRVETNSNMEMNSMYQSSPRRDSGSVSSEIDFSRFKASPANRFPPLKPEIKNSPSYSSSQAHSQNRSASTGRALAPSSPMPMRRIDSDTGVSVQYSSHSPTGHRMISKQPMLIQESAAPSSPMNHILLEDRDDVIQTNNSQFETESGSGYHSYIQSSTYAGAHEQQMDEIIIQKYIAEKNKFKAAEANNAMLHAHINEMSRKMEYHHNETDKERAAALAKFEEEMKKSESLELTVKQLREKLQRKEDETVQKLKAMQEDNEKKVRMVRDEVEIKMIGVRNEMMGVQKRYGAAKSRLEHEVEKSVEFTKRFEAMEQTFEEKNVHIKKEQERSKLLQESLDSLKKESEEKERSNIMQIKSLSQQVENVLEKYEFEKQKAQDFSNELKIMSVQYVENLEKLEAEEAKNDTLVKAIDEAEAKLDTTTKKAANTNNDLEEMAKGFIETDDLLNKEGEITSRLSTAINSLNVQLHNEHTKSKALAEEVLILEKSDKTNKDELSKLKTLTKSLSDQLTAVENNLALEVEKSTELSKSLKQTQTELEISGATVEDTQKTNKKLASEAAKFKLQSTSLQNDLNEITSNWKKDQETSAQISKQLQEQTDAFIKLKAKTMQEKNQSHEIFQEEEKKLKTLSTDLEGMIARCKTQDELITELQETLKVSTEKVEQLSEQLGRTEEIKTELEDTLEAERAENNENFQDHVEKFNQTSRELTEAEKKNTILFNNLLDTEEKLRDVNEALNVAKMQLETKDDEFRPLEDMLRQEIEAREKSLQEEQEKNILLTSQNVDMNKQCNEMHTSLVAAEERLLALQQASNELKNQIAAKDQESKNLQISLEKEQNGPHQRKIKVAKKMIQAEKTRYKALHKEVEAKDLMIKRVEEQSSKLEGELQDAKDELEIEREKHASHSKRALQDMHKQLEDERKYMRIEKEKLAQKLKAEKAQVKSLSIRLKTLERSTGETDVSNALKEHHQVEEKARVLMEENEQLKNIIDEKTKAEVKHEKRLEEVGKNLQDLTNYLDTMAQYCTGLEEEKKFLKKEVETLKNDGTKSNLFNLLEGEDSDDNDTVSGMSLSDFSVAHIPTSGRVSRPEIKNIMNRTNVISKSQDTLLRSSEEEIELTMDSEIPF